MLLIFILATTISEVLYAAIHDDVESVWNSDVIEDYASTNSSLLYNAEDLWPICEQEWNGNLSMMDINVLTEMVYALGQDDVTTLTQQEMLCLYFDTANITELRDGAGKGGGDTSDCSWQLVKNATDFPYYMHLRNDDYSTDVIAIRGTYSIEESMQDYVLYNQVWHRLDVTFCVCSRNILGTCFESHDPCTL